MKPTFINKLLVLVLATGLPLLEATEASLAAPTTQDVASAEATASEYTRLLLGGHGVDAMRAYWDFDGIFDTMFGADMKKQTDAERSEMRELLLTFCGNIYANPKLLERMANATYGEFKANTVSSQLTVVTFTVTLGSKSIPNSLHMTQKDGRWKIVKVVVSQSDAFDLIRKAYAADRTTTTPLEYIRAIASAKP